MLDITLILFTLVVALVVRAEPLRRLRPLTLPLTLTAAAALAYQFQKAPASDSRRIQLVNDAR